MSSVPEGKLISGSADGAISDFIPQTDKPIAGAVNKRETVQRVRLAERLAAG